MDTSLARRNLTVLPERLNSVLGLVGRDYDYGQGGAYNSQTGHWGDAGKLPNHPTFSNESNYSSASLAGGQWGSMFNRDGKVVETFTPSLDMITQGLAQYMQRVEPNVQLLPAKGNTVIPK